MTTDVKQTLIQKRTALKNLMLNTMFRATLLVTVCLFGVMYLFQTSSLSTKGYTISELERQVQKLEQENRRLEVNISEHRSIASVMQRLEEKDFVNTEVLTYVSDFGTAVAVR